MTLTSRQGGLSLLPASIASGSPLSITPRHPSRRTFASHPCQSTRREVDECNNTASFSRQLPKSCSPSWLWGSFRPILGALGPKDEPRCVAARANTHHQGLRMSTKIGTKYFSTRASDATAFCSMNADCLFETVGMTEPINTRWAVF